MTTRGHVLALYRQILRLSRTWESQSGVAAETQTERDYIRTEARLLFRKNKTVTDEKEINEFVREAETRIELALHYRVPYPRPVNIPQQTLPPRGARMRAQKRQIEQSKPIYLKSYKDTKD
ncbi:LYR motif-containing protein 1-like [Haliotis rubra]|uniref:LYR motif-containing protein 1-like n=1 Tax=Haliotis rubra TaxID=36100 RepID=UPI001EE5257C|nr:LYR motif-containing protein 1-like [Haliotis rubra]XP_046567608.1 LYR motif-containing protein 1-like [Haliotis rubra]